MQEETNIAAYWNLEKIRQRKVKKATPSPRSQLISLLTEQVMHSLAKLNATHIPTGGWGHNECSSSSFEAWASEDSWFCVGMPSRVCSLPECSWPPEALSPSENFKLD
jgi:hypothetical protein